MPTPSASIVVTSISQPATSLDTTGGDKSLSVSGYTAGDLPVTFVVGTGVNGTAFGLSDNHVDGLGTYTKIFDYTDTAGASQGSLFVRDRFIGSTASCTVTTTGLAASTGGGYYVTLIRGLGAQSEGSKAVRQSAVQNDVAANVLGLPSLRNPTLTSSYVLVGWNAAQNSSSGGGPGWSSISGLTYATPSFEFRFFFGSQSAITTQAGSYPPTAVLPVTSAWFIVEFSDYVGPAPALNAVEVSQTSLFPKFPMQGR